MKSFVIIVSGRRIDAAKVSFLIASLWLFVPGITSPIVVQARCQEATWTKQEAAIRDRIRKLRSLPDDVRARTTKQLAIDIRRLPAKPHKLDLAFAVANLSTEGDFGHDTLQEVATTLAEALRGDAPPMMG